MMIYLAIICLNITSRQLSNDCFFLRDNHIEDSIKPYKVQSEAPPEFDSTYTSRNVSYIIASL